MTVISLPGPGRAYGARDRHANLQAGYGYVTEEHLLSGDVHGNSFTARVLLRRPGDPSRCSGVTVLEPMHLEGSRPVWSTLADYLMRSGHTWVEVACQHQPTVRRLIPHDRQRYDAVHMDAGDPAESPLADGADPRSERDSFIASWWWASPQLVGILATTLAALKTGDIPGAVSRRVILAGISQTGGVVRHIAGAIERGELRPEGMPDGLLAANSGGGPMATAIPAIELLAEADLESVRDAAGLPGQGRALRHRQPDSATFRLYEVAGMSHMDSRNPPASRQPPTDSRWSRFPHAEVLAAALDALIVWVDLGENPPPGSVLDTDSGSDRLSRDDLGHALGGVRTIAADLPLARLEPIGDGGRAFPFGCEVPLTDAEIFERYRSVAGWRRLAGIRASELVAERRLLAADAEPKSPDELGQLR